MKIRNIVMGNISKDDATKAVDAVVSEISNNKKMISSVSFNYMVINVLVVTVTTIIVSFPIPLIHPIFKAILGILIISYTMFKMCIEIVSASHDAIDFYSTGHLDRLMLDAYDKYESNVENPKL